MTETHSNLTIRRLGTEDDAALAHLAERDSAEVPRTPLLGAEVEGRLLAAVSIRDGSSIADPFSRSDELRALLELRASQLRHRRPRFRRRPLRDAAPAALATASGGPGEQVLSLHPRAS